MRERMASSRGGKDTNEKETKAVKHKRDKGYETQVKREREEKRCSEAGGSKGLFLYYEMYLCSTNISNRAGREKDPGGDLP